MLDFNENAYGIYLKIPDNDIHYLQNINDLQKIWYQPSSYYDIVKKLDIQLFTDDINNNTLPTNTILSNITILVSFKYVSQSDTYLNRNIIATFARKSSIYRALHDK